MEKKGWLILSIIIVVLFVAFGNFKISEVITGNAPAYSSSSASSSGTTSSSKSVGSSRSAGSIDESVGGGVGSLEGPAGNGTYSTCLNEMCVSVPGNKTNECYSNLDCFPSNETHLECVLDSCREVNGTGINECDYVGQFCGNTHLECFELSCVEFNGTGIDECYSNLDCFPSNETHLECTNSQCVSVSGNGTDECSTNKECMIVSNNKSVVRVVADWVGEFFRKKPDLRVWAINTSVELVNIYNGTYNASYYVADVGAYIENIGKKEAPFSRTEFVVIPGYGSRYIYTPALSPGEGMWINSTYERIESGYYSVNVAADGRYEIDESNEFNNVLGDYFFV